MLYNKTILLLVVLLLVGCSSIQKQPWTKTDRVMFGAACAANAYDFYTTKRILDNNGHMKEEWRFLYLGKERPSTSALAVSKMAQLGLAYVFLDYVPSSWRKGILFLMTGTWIYYASGNDW